MCIHTDRHPISRHVHNSPPHPPSVSQCVYVCVRAFIQRCASPLSAVYSPGPSSSSGQERMERCSPTLSSRGLGDGIVQHNYTHVTRCSQRQSSPTPTLAGVEGCLLQHPPLAPVLRVRQLFFFRTSDVKWSHPSKTAVQIPHDSLLSSQF